MGADLSRAAKIKIISSGDKMKNRNPYFLTGQFAMAIGVLLNIFFKTSEPISFVSGFFIGLSLVFNIAFYLSLRKEKSIG